ncbi:LysR substrate-binding domain-containing protein [Dermacoccaceae bacterium W4C1]
MFSPEHLCTLRAVVQEGTVLAAADRLGLSASAVSQQLARLQKEAGQPVLVRRGRNLVPTDAAEVLVRMADEVEHLDEMARAELERLDSVVAGRFAWASFPTALVGLLAPATALLADQYPDLQVTYQELEPDLSLAPLQGGQVDLAVVHDWTDHQIPMPPGVQSHVLGTDQVDLLVPADHPLTRSKGIDAAELDGQSWIDDTPGVFSDWLLTTLTGQKVDFRIVAQVDHYPGKIALIEAGMGIGLVPRLGRAVLPDGVIAIPLLDPPTRRVLMAHRDASVRRPALEAAMSAVRQMWRAFENSEI